MVDLKLILIVFVVGGCFFLGRARVFLGEFFVCLDLLVQLFSFSPSQIFIPWGTLS